MKRQRDRQGWVPKTPPPIGLEEKDWVHWTRRGSDHFMERKEQTWEGPFPHQLPSRSHGKDIVSSA